MDNMTALMKLTLAAGVVALFIQTPATARKLTQIGSDMGKCTKEKMCNCKDSDCAQIAAPPRNSTHGHSNTHPRRQRK